MSLYPPPFPFAAVKHAICTRQRDSRDGHTMPTLDKSAPLPLSISVLDHPMALFGPDPSWNDAPAGTSLFIPLSLLKFPALLPFTASLSFVPNNFLLPLLPSLPPSP